MSARDAADPAYRERWISAEDGLPLYIRDYGDPLAIGVPLLCLSGFVRNSKDYDDFALRHAARRRVVTMDYRGRGRSAHAPDWRGYRADIYLRDVAQVIVAANLHPTVICGTSFGGWLAMGLAVSNPTVIAGVILNDVGPDLQPDGVEQITSYIEQANPLPDWDAATAEVKEFRADLGYTSDERWREVAEATYRVGDDGRLYPDWDPKIAKTLGQDAPDLWSYFRALRSRPVLSIRGELSPVLSEATVAAMLAEHPDMIQVEVPGIGHAPFLTEAKTDRAIHDFLAHIDS